jgi:hypothetical protein
MAFPRAHVCRQLPILTRPSPAVLQDPGLILLSLFNVNYLLNRALSPNTLQHMHTGRTQFSPQQKLKYVCNTSLTENCVLLTWLLLLEKWYSTRFLILESDEDLCCVDLHSEMAKCLRRSWDSVKFMGPQHPAWMLRCPWTDSEVQLLLPILEIKFFLETLDFKNGTKQNKTKTSAESWT